MKKICCAVISIITSMVSLTLTGCGSSNGESNSEYPGGTVKVAFAECGFGRTYLENWTKNYNIDNPDNKINFVLDGDSQMTQNIVPQIQSGANVADVVMVLSTNWQSWAVKGLVAPIDDVYEAPFDDAGTTIGNAIQDNYQSFGLVNSHYYAIPWSCGPAGIVYNKGMFADYGWTIPKTFDELITLCATIKSDSKGTVAPFAWSGATSAYWDFVTLNWWAQVEGVDGWKTFWDFGSPEVFKQDGRLKALSAFQTMICGDGVPLNSIEGCSSKTFMQAQMAFVNGEAAMCPNGSWLENEVKSSMDSNFKMAYMPTPAIEGAKTNADGTVKDVTVNSSGDFMLIPAKASNIDGAKKFLKYINTEKQSENFTRDSGGIRAFKYSPSKVEGISDFTKDCAEVFEKTENLFITSSNAMYYDNSLSTWPGYGTPYSRMIQDGDSAQTVMDSIYNYVNTNWSKFQDAAGIGK